MLCKYCQSIKILHNPWVNAHSPYLETVHLKEEVMWKHGGQCLLRHVRAGQLEQTGLLGRGSLKKTKRVNRGAAAVDNMRKNNVFFILKVNINSFDVMFKKTMKSVADISTEVSMLTS